MRPEEPILIICYFFPPNAGIGGRRWAKFAKELARRGHTVHVIRSAGGPGQMGSLWTEDAQTPGVVAHPLPARYPGVFNRFAPLTLQDKIAYQIWQWVLPKLTRYNWYDRGIFWRKQLLRKASKLIREHHIRNVVVTGAPFSLMAYAAELKKPFPEINLIGDFRDPWTWGMGYGFGTLNPERMRREKAQEALVVREFDKLTASTSSIIRHLQDTYGGPPERYLTIPHVIDPDEIQVTTTREKDGVFKMIYAGSLYDGAEAALYYKALWGALEALRDKYPTAFANFRLDLYITVRAVEIFAQELKDRGLDKHVVFHAPVPPRTILERIAGADLVLAFLPENKKDIMVTKFSEIFHLHRPVLHIGEPGLVSRTIKERRLGDSLRVKELEKELPLIISGERKIEIDTHADHSEHLLRNITDLLVKNTFV